MAQFLILLFGVGCIAASLVPGPMMYRFTQAWQWRDAKANEPSRLAYALRRTVWAVVGVFLIGIGVSSALGDSGSGNSARESGTTLEEVVDDVVQSLNGRSVRVTSDGVDENREVRSTVDRRAPSSMDVRVRHGSNGRHIVSSDGSRSFCIRTGHTVMSDDEEERFGRARMRASSTSGAC